MKKLIITCLLLVSASFVGSAQVVIGPRDLTPAEVTAAQTTATNTTNTLNATLAFTPTQYSDVNAIEFVYQKQFDKYTVNGDTPSSGQLGNMTISRDQKLQQVMTPAQYATYLTMPH